MSDSRRFNTARLNVPQLIFCSHSQIRRQIWPHAGPPAPETLHCLAICLLHADQDDRHRSIPAAWDCKRRL